MDFDRMMIQVKSLLDFKDKVEPLLNALTATYGPDRLTVDVKMPAEFTAFAEETMPQIARLKALVPEIEAMAAFRERFEPLLVEAMAMRTEFHANREAQIRDDAAHEASPNPAASAQGGTADAPSDPAPPTPPAGEPAPVAPAVPGGEAPEPAEKPQD